MNEHSHPMPFFPSRMPFSLMLRLLKSPLEGIPSDPHSICLCLATVPFLAFLHSMCIREVITSFHSSTVCCTEQPPSAFVCLSTQKVPSPCTSLFRPSFPTEDASQGGQSGAQVTDPQVLALTVRLWALLSASVSPRRAVWQGHVFLYPEYLAPGLVWVRQSVVTTSTNKWGKQLRPSWSMKSEQGHPFFPYPCGTHSPDCMESHHIRLFIYMPVCIPGALEMWFNFLIFHF